MTEMAANVFLYPREGGETVVHSAMSVYIFFTDNSMSGGENALYHPKKHFPSQNFSNLG